MLASGIWISLLLSLSAPDPAPAGDEAAPAADTAAPTDASATDAGSAQTPPADGADAPADAEGAEGAAETGAPGDPSVAESDVPAEPVEPEPEPEPETEPAEPEPEPESESEPAAPISSVMDALEPSEPPPLVPKHRLVYKNLTAARYNPLGLVNENAMGWAMRLYEKRGALFEPAYLGAKLHTYVSPAYSRIGPQLEFSPLAILNLSATYDFVGYYGTFNQMQSFPTPAADYSDTALERNADEDDAAYPTYGSLVTLSALLQAKAGPIAVRDNFKAYYSNFKLRDDGRVFYDQALDIMVPNNGWAMTNDLDVLVLFKNGLKLGARYTVTHAAYKSRHFQDMEPQSQPNGPTHRVGPAILYTFYDKPEKRFNKPTLLVLTQWWAKHRYRTGQDVSGAVPYIVAGFLFEGTLLPDPGKRKAKR